jgi:hypothetical protein
MFKFVRTLDVFFSDAAAGNLPNVSFITPWFGGPFRTDDHPHGDIVLGQRYIEALYTAFVRSPQWQRGMFVLVYDEWGGFFDHVRPPVVPDPRSSSEDDDNFGQTGFRVPSMAASPYARRGYVDHNLYDHTSILRFLEWRFLGAPAQGPDRGDSRWFLTKRDRYANNYGASLKFEDPDPEVDLEELEVETLEAVVPPCDDEDRLEKVGTDQTPRHGFEPTETLDAIVRQNYGGVSFKPWLRETGVSNVPALPDDRPR